MALYQLDDRRPEVHASAYVAESAELIGAIHIAEGASVWGQVTMRGDNEPIRIGKGSNVQEGSVLHTDLGFPLTVGEGVTVGHQAMLHGCTVGDGALIGIQAVVLNGARIGRDCLVGAGALVTEGKVFEDGQLILGSPAKAVRPLNEAELARLKLGALSYVERGSRFNKGLKRVG
ncbi:gamma carbonic anhydrase family protein [Rivibacter subsaxonicus]|uniref:Carbonic anhydrase/acetyltransferase-like protein (Isoleucine patch superfamily) n=1 Tax=Rivibacter subsaxonicus TaxID=457575 RepID=A0A4Q7V791_9BURK|nr:gamma carbonic anhydrase family protein [Rivibacter subsaxonicus]RZT92496.1 carbonic anhydrase/acetyltransferase-like protein (isoleucine patch superfamily) [Rivibacter subsaxonicus]